VPDAVAHAPGRVNLLGEHTDYNDGFVLPIALAQQTTVAIGRADGRLFSLRSEGFAAPLRFALDRIPDQPFGRYVFGCIQEIAKHGHAVPPLDMHVSSELPMGVGLSSSAALEVATLRALRALLALPIDDVEIARMAQRAEVEYAGVRCGIMDQMAASLADTEHALFLDARTLATRLWPLPAGAAVLVLDSGVPRALVNSGFNQRRHECEEACARLVAEEHARSGRRYFPIGSAHLTTAGALPFRGVIHCVASDAFHATSEETIASCVRNALRIADDESWANLAMPLFGTGHAAFQVERATEAMAGVLTRITTRSVQRVVILVRTDEQVAAMTRAVARR
jgi:galactokinase